VARFVAEPQDPFGVAVGESEHRVVVVAFVAISSGDVVAGRSQFVGQEREAAHVPVVVDGGIVVWNRILAMAARIRCPERRSHPASA
jgi:hypothetical protein